MTKIIAGVTGLVATVALVGSVAFAQFSAQVTASNVVFATGNAALEVTDPSNPSNFLSTLDLTGISFDNFTPGEVESQSFQIRNSGSVPLNLSLRLTSATGDWGPLNSVMEMRIYPTGTTAPAWQTFAYWNAEERTLEGNPIEIDNPVTAESENIEDWTVEVRLNPSANNTAAGKTVNTNWVLNGTDTSAL
ncbi:MAG: hypothetical protein KatS3mg087_0993 [Patescibacteria group bacterium]|nr:MAG: hypothetical protein KatS3mg087_0993 [Patescibacteria group bacterium]